jgi:predicted secreted protein
LRVKFRDFKALAKLARELGGRPGVTLERIDWALTEATRAKVEVQVLAGAVKRARDRAVVIAKAAGAVEVVAVEITDPGLMRNVLSSVNSGYGVVAERSSSKGDSDDLQLVPEDVVVRTTVHARFQTAR